MKIRLTRNIYYSAPGEGLTSSMVYKDYDWELVPILGAVVDDSAWHRNDITKIESININAEEGNIYYVELNPKEVGVITDVKRYVEIVKHHGWNEY